MQVSKYLYKHFAQLNCHNLNYGVKITYDAAQNVMLPSLIMISN